MAAAAVLDGRKSSQVGRMKGTVCVSSSFLSFFFFLWLFVMLFSSMRF